MGVPSTAALCAVVAYVVYPLTQRMPPPYDGVAASAVSAADLDLYPGQPGGTPIPPVLEGAWAPNDRLRAATRLFEGVVAGSESVATLDGGDLLLVDKFGWVWISAGGTATPTRTWYVGPGRPLGFHAHRGKLLVACSTKGLLELDLGSGALRILANMATDTREPLNYVNDLAVDGATGDVYFSSSTELGVRRDGTRGFYDTMQGYLMNLMRGDHSGRLLKYDARTGATTTLAAGLAYANGVALSPDASFAVVAETNRARLMKVDLATGEMSVFVDGLPALPDGVTAAADGFWIAGIARPAPVAAKLAPYPALRTLAAHVAPYVFPVFAKPWSGALKVGFDGAPLDALYDPTGERVSTMSCVVQHGSRLYLGNLAGDFVSVVDLGS